MFEFRVCPHLSIIGKEMVEIWRDGVFVAGLYPHEDGIRVVSKYMKGVSEDKAFPPSAVFHLALEEAAELEGSVVVETGEEYRRKLEELDILQLGEELYKVTGGEQGQGNLSREAVIAGFVLSKLETREYEELYGQDDD